MKPGGMSRVALVWNSVSRCEEVLKINDPLSGDRAEAVRRFQDEINIASRLTGQVVPVYRSGSLGGHLYYTMPYLRGGSLRDRLDAGELPIEEGVTILRDVARAVDKLHNYRTDGRLTPIVHRDLKPANILFADRGNADPRIADLGLAKLLDEAAGPGGFRTSTGQSMGTPGYMAPEQILGAPGGIGPAADVHALGAILYEILTGRRPFEESTIPATLIRTLSDDPAPPRQVAPKRAPAGLERRGDEGPQEGPRPTATPPPRPSPKTSTDGSSTSRSAPGGDRRRAGLVDRPPIPRGLDPGRALRGLADGRRDRLDLALSPGQGAEGPGRQQRPPAGRVVLGGLTDRVDRRWPGPA